MNMRRNTAVIVTCAEEVKAAFHALSYEALYLATNQKVFQTCREANLSTLCLSEDLLGDEVAELNDWSYQETIRFLSGIKDGRDVKKCVFLGANFYSIKGVLVQGAKYIVTIDKILQGNPINAVYLFETTCSLLCSACTEYLTVAYPYIKIQWLAGSISSLGRKRSAYFRTVMCWIMAAVSNVIARCLLRFSPKRARRILASGALSHLGSLIQELKLQNGCFIIYLEKELDFTKFVFCLRNLIPYFIVPQRGQYSNPLEGLEDGWKFQFRGHDCTRLFQTLFLVALRKGDIAFAYDFENLEMLLKDMSLSAIILDEDLSLERRLLSVLGEKLRVESYVMSHGVPIQRLKKETFNRLSFHSAITVVHSPLEKRAYERLYFEPDRLPVLGIPRYDEIVRIKQRSSGSKKQHHKKLRTVLLCLSGFEDYDFESFMTVLVGADSIGRNNRKYIKDVINALDGNQDVFLRIKTHFVGEELPVGAYLKTLKPRVPYKIESQRANTFRLEMEADIIVTPESTVVAEAVMFQKPVVVVMYRQSEVVSPFAVDDAVSYVSDGATLRKVMTALLTDSSYYAAAVENLNRQSKYFEQFSDGCSAGRVADYITNRMTRDASTLEYVTYECNTRSKR